MKILARSILMLLALGFATFGDLFDFPMNTAPVGILAEDSDVNLDITKCWPLSEDDAVVVSELFFGNATSIQVLPRLPDTVFTARYKLLSIYRL